MQTAPRLLEIRRQTGKPAHACVCSCVQVIRKAGEVIPIVAMTANASDRDRDECLDAGMDGFLSKPVLRDRLAEAILSVVSGRRNFMDKDTVALKPYERL